LPFWNTVLPSMRARLFSTSFSCRRSGPRRCAPISGRATLDTRFDEWLSATHFAIQRVLVAGSALPRDFEKRTAPSPRQRASASFKLTCVADSNESERCGFIAAQVFISLCSFDQRQRFRCYQSRRCTLSAHVSSDTDAVERFVRPIRRVRRAGGLRGQGVIGEDHAEQSWPSGVRRSCGAFAHRGRMHRLPLGPNRAEAVFRNCFRFVQIAIGGGQDVFPRTECVAASGFRGRLCPSQAFADHTGAHTNHVLAVAADHLANMAGTHREASLNPSRPGARVALPLFVMTGAAGRSWVERSRITATGAAKSGCGRDCRSDQGRPEKATSGGKHPGFALTLMPPALGTKRESAGSSWRTAAGGGADGLMGIRRGKTKKDKRVQGICDSRIYSLGKT